MCVTLCMRHACSRHMTRTVWWQWNCQGQCMYMYQWESTSTVEVLVNGVVSPPLTCSSWYTCTCTFSERCLCSIIITSLNHCYSISWHYLRTHNKSAAWSGDQLRSIWGMCTALWSTCTYMKLSKNIHKTCTCTYFIYSWKCTYMYNTCIKCCYEFFGLCIHAQCTCTCTSSIWIYVHV